MSDWDERDQHQDGADHSGSGSDEDSVLAPDGESDGRATEVATYDEEPQASTPEEAPRTGHHEVDAVIASLDSLDHLPAAEHVEVFERAHEALRRALAGASDGPRPGAPGGAPSGQA